MSTTPLPSPVHFIQNVHHLPAGCKVRVLGFIQSYDPDTGIMTLHHQPTIDVPLPRVQNGQRSRKRPGGTLRNEKVVNGVAGGSMGGRRGLPQQAISSSHKVVVVNGNTERRRMGGSSVTQGTGSSKMGNGGSSTISNGPGNGISRGVKPPAAAQPPPPTKPTPQRPSDPP
ncbi:uncharacterized protein DFL_009392 [Arthrobotrys flagrans]|uniref:Uncharacterized protein n=1 Tax=Arthrobotrys flagrans TaxID=97331 RepID=A0A436ZRG3_ARTFL|nr:hypothetical protein DFL_009392 [Arthrobotrys flagrans]